jgi:hypothetical protein
MYLDPPTCLAFFLKQKFEPGRLEVFTQLFPPPREGQKCPGRGPQGSNWLVSILSKTIPPLCQDRLLFFFFDPLGSKQPPSAFFWDRKEMAEKWVLVGSQRTPGSKTFGWLGRLDPPPKKNPEPRHGYAPGSCDFSRADVSSACLLGAVLHGDKFARAQAPIVP